MTGTDQDDFYMRELVRMVRHREGEEPFGAMVVKHVHGHKPQVLSRFIGTGVKDDPTRHSEVIALQRACALIGGPLVDCTLYSTHEPCAMCAGAVVHTKPSRVVFGSYRSDLPHLFTPRVHYTSEWIMRDCSTPREVVGGVRREECVALFDLPVASPTTLF